jgi:hypothetical protein
MKNDSQSIITRLPKGAEISVFGSALWRREFKDVDVLIVYDPDTCPPETAHERVADSIRLLADLLGHPVHMVLLTLQEERTCGFKHDAGCVPLHEAIAANPALRAAHDKTEHP